MFEAVLVILLLLVFFLIAYKGAIHEFQILQKDWKPTIDWSSLLSEQLPLVIRNVDPSWQAQTPGHAWTRKATAQKPWPVQVLKDGQRMRTRWNEWIASPPGQPQLTPDSQQELTALITPPIALWDDGGFHRWSWIPAHLTPTTCRLLGPKEVLPLRKTTSAATVLQATDGAPLSLWIAHEGAIPASVLPRILGKDPWSLSTEDVPWISEVKFIELRLRPGNALVLPTHWYWAAKAEEGEIGGDVGSMGDGSWFWTADFHTPISWLVSAVQNRK